MKRTFHYLGELTEDGLVEHDRDEVRQTLLDLESALYQLGGIVTVSAVRAQIGEDSYVTTGMVIQYDSFSPAVRRQVTEDVPLEADDLIEDEAEDGTPEPSA